MVNKVLVADVSSFQPSSLAYFKQLKDNGIKAVFVKLTEGTGWVSPVASVQISNAFKAGIKVVGAYHFFHGNGTAEARYFLYWVKQFGLYNSTPLMLDAETTDIGGSGAQNAFLDEVHKYGFNRQFVYSMESYFGTRIIPSQLHHGYLWVANYGGSFNTDGVTLWQFTDNYHSLSTDMSYCYFPERLGLSAAKSVATATKVNGKTYYTTGSQFKVTNAAGVNAYADASMTKASGIRRGKDYVIYGKIVMNGKYPRIKTVHGNYYTTRTDLVQRIK